MQSRKGIVNYCHSVLKDEVVHFFGIDIFVIFCQQCLLVGATFIRTLVATQENHYYIEINTQIKYAGVGYTYYLLLVIDLIK